MTVHSTLAGVSALVIAGGAVAAPRDVQFRSVDLDARIIQLHNYGDTTEDLSGWQFCSHDDSLIRRYSGPGGLNGVSIEADTSLFVHFNDDAPAGDPDRVNIGDLNGNMANLDNGPFSIQIYRPPVVFANGNTMADIIQWSINGADDFVADERTDEALAGGLWMDEGDWISTTADSGYIRLDDLTGAELHSSADYSVFDEMPDCNGDGLDDFFQIASGELADENGDGVPDVCGACPADLDGSGEVDATDLGTLIAAWGSPTANPSADLDGNDDVDATDLGILIAAWGPCS